MKDVFSSGKGKKVNVGMQRGGYKEMMEMRKKQLPDIEDTIRDALKDYEGQNVCVIVQHEDENGMPEHATIVMAGVGRMETQIAMAKALHNASKTAMEVLMKGADGNVDAMLEIASALVDDIKRDRRGR